MFMSNENLTSLFRARTELKVPMSDDCEYELNALCQKLIKVLTDHECLSKTRSVYKVDILD